MNVFTTDHPMVKDPSPAAVRFQKRLFMLVLGYVGYLLALGPFFALAENGDLEFVPTPIVDAAFVPVMPVALVPGIRDGYVSYLGWWYDPQNTTP